MMYDKDGIKAGLAIRYYVVFDKMRERKWWNIFTGSKFAHVWLVTELSDHATLVLDTTKGSVTLLKLNRSVESVVRQYRKQGLVIATTLIKNQEKGLQLFVSCVGFCKYILGIDKWWIVTPKQLYKELYNAYRQND